MLSQLTRDLVPPLLVSSALVMAMLFVGLFLLCVKRYEVAILLILASAWVHCFFYKNEADALGQAESNPATYIRMLLVVMVGVIGYLKLVQDRKASPERFPLHFKLLGAFLLLALFSTTYSISRTFTLVRVVEFLAFYGFLLELHYWCHDKANMDKAINALFLVTAAGMVVNLGSLFLWRSHVWYFESPNRFQGVMGGPNHLGAFIMVSYVVFMWKFATSDARGRMWSVLFFLIALFMHGLSGSRSSIFSAVLGFFIWAIAMKQTKVLGFLLILIISGVIAFSAADLPSLKREQADRNSIADLTGRTNIWKKSLQALEEKPLLGYGFQVGGAIFTHLKLSSTDYFLNDNATARFQLHNGYLSVAIGCGIPGLLLWLAVLLLPLKEALALPLSPYKALGIVMIVQCLTLNCVEDFVSNASRMMPSMFFWIGWVICARLSSLQRGAPPYEEAGLYEEAT
jgi:hypothetical protein